MKKALYAAMLIALLGHAMPASAVAVGPGYLGNLTGNSYVIGNSFSGLSHGLNFSDVYTFDLSSTSQSVGTTVTINVDLGSLNFELNDMAISLTDSTGAIVYDADSQLLSGTTLAVDALLSAGSGYRFVVAGTVAGSLGGSYGGVLQAVPVPEAQTCAMMAAGLALVGLAARRRRLPA
jgi:zona occludens toxin (predicted ATPase)